MADAQTDFGTNIPARLADNPEKASAINATFLINVTGDGGGTWTINCKDNVGVTEGDAGNSDTQVTISTEDWVAISENPSSAMQLYFAGKLKVEGNPMLATKLTEILG